MFSFGLHNKEIKELNKRVNELEKENASLRQLSKEAERYMRENEILHSDNQAAARIQRSMLLSPGNIYDSNDIKIYADVDFAKSVGGDLYDCFTIPNGKVCFYVGDVSGKGVPAVSYMVAAKLLIKAKVTDENNLDRVMEEINKELYYLSSERQFVTLFLCVYDPLKKEIHVMNAGHNPGLIHGKDNKIKVIDTRSGIPLGSYYNEFKPEINRYKSYTIKIDEGDTLILYTDGCTEAMNPEGEAMGQSDFEELIKKSAAYEEIGDRVRFLQRGIIQYAHHEEQDDDITVLGVSFL